MKKYYIISLLFVFAIQSIMAHPIIDKKLDSINNLIVHKKKYNIDQIYSFLGQTHYPKKAIKTLRLLKTEAENEQDDFKTANAYYALGNYFYYNSQIDSAAIYLDRTKPFLKKLKKPMFAASVLMSRGQIFKTEGQVVKANAKFLESLNILDKVDTLKLDKKEKKKLFGKKMVLYNGLAVFHKELKEYDKAANYYHNAYNLAINKLHSKWIAAVLLSNQSDLLIKNKEYQKALDLLDQSLKLIEQSKNPNKNIYKINMYINIGDAKIGLKQYDDALKFLNLAIEKTKGNKNSSKYLDAITSRSKLYFETKQYKKAVKDGEIAYAEATKQKNIDFQQKASNVLAKSYKQLNNYQKSLYYLEKKQIFKDSIYNKENVKKMTQMQMQYAFDREKEIQDIKNKAIIKQNKTIIYSLSAGLLSLLLLSSLIYRLYTIRQKNNKVLSQKNKQINKALADYQTLLKETHHRVKNSLQMISSLLYLQSENISDKLAAASVKDGQIRVKSMALIHQKLYQEGNLTGVEVSDYIKDLAESVFQSHNVSNADIDLQIDVEKMVLDIDTVTPIGIIVNELIVNILKHAFTENKKDAYIKISLYKKDDELILNIADNGKGFTAADQKEKSFGMKLIHSLARKLKADIIFEHHQGTEVTLKIKRFIIKNEQAHIHS